jgi:hypothetical protein
MAALVPLIPFIGNRLLAMTDALTMCSPVVSVCPTRVHEDGNTEMWCAMVMKSFQGPLEKLCQKLRNQPTRCSRRWAAHKSSGLRHLAPGDTRSPVKSCSIEETINTVSSSYSKEVSNSLVFRTTVRAYSESSDHDQRG